MIDTHSPLRSYIVGHPMARRGPGSLLPLDSHGPNAGLQTDSDCDPGVSGPAESHGDMMLQHPTGCLCSMRHRIYK